MLVDAIEKEFAKAAKWKWDKIYVFIDFHEVVIKPDYQSEESIVDYYDNAKELLQHLSNRKDICLIAWTCSHPEQIEGYVKIMAQDGIQFDYINENPEIKTDAKYGCYDKKPYYNIMLDDKAGVSPNELGDILNTFMKYNLD